MKSFLQQWRNFSVATIAASVLLGLILLVFPEASIKYISIAFGAVLILIGVWGVIQYFAKKSGTLVMIMGVIVLVCGIIVCVKYRTIISIVELLFGIFLLCSGIVNFISSLQSSVRKTSSWWVTLILSVVSMAFGIISVIRPFAVSTTLVRFIGAGLLVYAVLDLISYIRFKKISRAVEDAVNRNSEIIDENARIVDDNEN